jgi:hypothetical protein
MSPHSQVIGYIEVMLRLCLGYVEASAMDPKHDRLLSRTFRFISASIASISRYVKSRRQKTTFIFTAVERGLVSQFANIHSSILGATILYEF